jgi:hypothetical protein
MRDLSDHLYYFTLPPHFANAILLKVVLSAGIGMDPLSGSEAVVRLDEWSVFRYIFISCLFENKHLGISEAIIYK